MYRIVIRLVKLYGKEYWERNIFKIPNERKSGSYNISSNTRNDGITYVSSLRSFNCHHFEDRMKSNRGQERDQNKVGELHNNHNGNGKEESHKSPQTDMIIGKGN